MCVNSTLTDSSIRQTLVKQGTQKRVPAFLYSFKLTLDGTDIFKQWWVYETGRQKEEAGKRLVRDKRDSVNIICTQKTGSDHKNSRVKWTKSNKH